MKQQIVQEEYEGISFQIRRLQQAKRLSLKVAADGRVWVSMPHRMSLSHARQFFRSHLPFVQKSLEKFRNRASEQTLQAAVPVKGVWYQLDIQDGAAPGYSIHHHEHRFSIILPNSSHHHSEERKTKAFQCWFYTMQHEANRILPARAIELSESVGEHLKKVSIRNQKTLWGSCSSLHRHISLNWRCILFPDEVRDYLIYHEIAHFRHQNHSHEYWAWVQQLCPWYQKSEQWLRNHGRAIMLIAQSR